ncbi:hypothetical protein [Planctopirus hydrillae]|nr:hypothetical protein [Planctopirus hydrillae]
MTPMAGPVSSTGSKSSPAVAKFRKLPLDVRAAVESLRADSAAESPADASLHAPVWLLVELSPEILSTCRSDLRDLRVEVEDPAKKEPLIAPSIAAEAGWIVRNLPRSAAAALVKESGSFEVQRRYEPYQVSDQWDEASRVWTVLIETRNLPVGAVEWRFPAAESATDRDVEIPVEVERAVPEAGVSPWDCILRTRVAQPGQPLTAGQPLTSGQPSTAGQPSAVEVSFVVSNINQHRLLLGGIPPEMNAASFRPESISLRGPRLLLAFPVQRPDLANCTYSLCFGDRQALSPGFELGLDGESQFLDQLEQACEPLQVDDVLQQLGQGLKSPLVPNASLR